MMCRREASVWQTAAEFLRNTTLTPDPIIAELVAALQELLRVQGHLPEYRAVASDAASALLAKIEGAV